MVDNVVGTTVQNFSQEIVQEFQLGISNFDLSTGASATGSVNIISKSGSNDFHGNGYIYGRHNDWAAFPTLGWLSTRRMASRRTREPVTPQEAETILARAHQVSGKKLAAVHLQLARLYEKRGDRNRAAGELEQYLKSPEAKNSAAIRDAIRKLRAPDK